MAEKSQLHDLPRGVEDHVESREETIERVLHEDAEVRERSGVEETGDVGGDVLAADISTRRGLNLALAIWFGAGAVIGGALGLALGYVLKEVVGPNPVGGVGDGPVLPLSLALAFGLIGGLIGAYFQLEAEDGRIGRGVDQELDRGTGATGRGPAPESRPGLVNSDKLPVVLGIIGILGAFTGVAAIASIAAVWTGARLRRHTASERSRSLATLGIVTGVVGVVLIGLLLLWGATVIPWDGFGGAESERAV